MDPFSAFGVAANVIAFVDFSWKLCSSAREIYRTGEGTTGDIHFLGIIVKDIQRYNRDLVASHSTDNVLDDIVAEARQLSAKLLEKTEQLTQKKSSRWKSFTIALQGVLKQRELNAWITQLERLQKRISDHVQLMTL
ncbi:hypothetical protein F5Y14DRAFT_454288 [Nemania sp. NC0429]|nr:hypothetical protein F5Y14DRAFT_454288 [Nemania sp. NC0429]